jgi:prolyl-tRNA synthetase
MRAERGVEVGNIFKLGTGYAEAAGAYFLDRDGRRKPVVMGSYGIGVGRLLACIAEEHRDEDGLVWAVCVAPYHVRLVASEHEAAPSLYEGLASADVEVLYDDRRESLGTKFKDADLIGAPARLTLTPRPLNSGGVEMKLRRERGSRIVPVDEAVEVVQQRLSELEAELLGTDSRR